MSSDHPIPKALRDRFDQIEDAICRNRIERDAVFTQMRTAVQAHFMSAETEEGDHDGRQLEWERCENKRLRERDALLSKATAFVQRLCDAAGSQPSVATGYLHDILGALQERADLSGSAEPSARVAVVLPERLTPAELEELEVIEVLLHGQGLSNLAGTMAAARQFIDEVAEPAKDDDWHMNPCKKGHRDVGAAGGVAHCYQCDEKIVATTTQEAFEQWNATHPATQTKCKVHNQYKAIRKPTADCEACRQMWSEKQAARTEPANKEIVQ